MKKTMSVAVLFFVAASAFAMELSWTGMTGQYPVECAPVVTDNAIVAVNRHGEVLQWPLNAGLSSEPDPVVATLPEGLWTSTPAAFLEDDKVCYAFVSNEGLVVVLDSEFNRLWEYNLGASVKFGTGTAGVIDGKFVLCDESGKVTSLSASGELLWQKPLATGACGTPVRMHGDNILAAAGNSLHCLSHSGDVVWSRDLGALIGSVASINDSQMILCGAGTTLCALNGSGEEMWRAEIGDEVVSTAKAGNGLVLCRGLWGNLSAFDFGGRHVWTHHFRTKSRGCPLTVNGDKILLTGYNQHAHLLDGDGLLLDDLRVCGAINGAPVTVGDDALVVTAALMAQRIKFDSPKSQYGGTPKPDGVTVAWRDDTAVITNPAGALITVNLEVASESGERWIQGTVTARSAFEVALPGTVAAGRLVLSVRDATGNELARDSRDKEVAVNDNPQARGIIAWAATAYGLFDETGTAPSCRYPDSDVISISNLYIGETDQAACILKSQLDAPCRVRVELKAPVTEHGVQFGGAIKLYEMAATPTINGEHAVDALVSLGDAGLVQIPAHRAAGIWISADAESATPGDYAGEICFNPLEKDMQPFSLPLRIHVPDLRLRRPFPLTLCTWDYIPNNWFPSRTKEVLDDMCRHGVNVFPRSNCVPKATVDASGDMTVDFGPLDEELAWLDGRGQLLLQLALPPIEFAADMDDAGKHAAQIAYLHQLRDHLKSRGWDYDDYAFYPVDEPGLGFGPNVPPLIEAGRLFREADPKFRVYTDPVPTLSHADFNSIEPLIDVWCPNMRMVTGLVADEPRIKRIMNSGKTVWSYDCVAQVKSISPLRYNRAAAWRAKHFGLDGIGFWTFSTTQVDHWRGPEKGIEEYALVYPGVMPVGSVRWEAVRDGLEDIAAAALLEQAMEKRKGDAAYADLIREAETTLRIAQTDILELSDQAFVESRDFLQQGDRRIWHTATDAAMYDGIRARIAELTLALRSEK